MLLEHSVEACLTELDSPFCLSFVRNKEEADTVNCISAQEKEESVLVRED